MSTKQRRLDQVLANCGYGSRREVSRLIRAGLVREQAESVRDPSQKVDPAQVTFDGEPLDHPLGITILLHKPVGYVCSHDSSEGPRVYDMLPPRWMERNPQLVTAGRLDKDTSGALVVTDDTKLAHRLASGKREVGKVYEVELDGELDGSVAQQFSSGTLLLKGETDPCLPAQLDCTGPRTCRVRLTEGRYHQVKRMFAACGLHVTRLHRSAFGPFELGELACGIWREILPDELADLGLSIRS